MLVVTAIPPNDTQKPSCVHDINIDTPGIWCHTTHNSYTAHISATSNDSSNNPISSTLLPMNIPARTTSISIHQKGLRSSIHVHLTLEMISCSRKILALGCMKHFICGAFLYQFWMIMHLLHIIGIPNRQYQIDGQFSPHLKVCTWTKTIDVWKRIMGKLCFEVKNFSIFL